NEGSPVISTISLGSFVEMKSVASLLAKNDLRAVCSISGTTIDMVLGSLSTAGNVARMKTLLKPLNDHAHALYMYKKALANPVLGAAPAGAPPVMPNEPGFQKLFTAISFFMQSGQYHSSGEVLGGLFIASMTLAAHGNLPAAPPADPAMLADYTALSEAKRRSSLIQETYDTFDALAADFAQHPENYFALDAVDKAKLITPEFKTAIQTLKEADLDRITGP
ncbi:MAG: hypothetical protein WCN87_04485, partial [Chlamydiota bacterium]